MLSINYYSIVSVHVFFIFTVIDEIFQIYTLFIMLYSTKMNVSFKSVWALEEFLVELSLSF